ncbi:MAG: class I SAM-dependent methyltransferase [Opitutales bacterium]
MEAPIFGIDSLAMFTNSKGIKGRGTLVFVSRSLAVIEIYNPYSIVQLSEVMAELRLVRGERTLYRGKAVVTSIVHTGLMTIASLTLTEAWNGLIAATSEEALLTEVEEFLDDWDKSNDIADAYQLVVNQMSRFLAEVSRWAQEAETAVSAQDFGKESEAEAVKRAIERPTSGRIARFFQLFEEEASKVPAEDVPLYKAFARREIHPYMLCTPFAYRTYTKPLGYAGDYEMVNMMLQESDAKTEGSYAQIFQDVQTNVAAAIAHRNRIDFLSQRIAEEAERVTDEQRLFTALDVGCGPASEVQRFIRTSPLASQSIFHLMDFNHETLDFAAQRVERAKAQGSRAVNVEFIERSIDDLLREAGEAVDSAPQPLYDLVYCAGLFDYFTDVVCRRLTQLFYGMLRPGGLLVTTNVTPRNPERYTMEHLLEWYLIYRDEESMAGLAPANTNPKITVDDTGVNVFFELRKQP